MTPATQDSPPAPAPSLGPSPTDPAQKPPEPWGWTRRQRLALGTLLTLLLAVLIIYYLRRPYRLGDSVVIVNGQQITLPQRIDPNTADERELSRVPHIGETLAGKIIQWRDARKPTAPDGIVFRQLSDLDPIPGIGKKLLAEMEPFLTFPDDAPAAEPNN